ncbi:MAG: hypothetical protein H0U10_17470 [Chloroflexia bacterium]|nr:hypothetical protein [Chloroflexia bacterium]
MGNRNFKTCIISAPLGVDTAPLREALSERGVKSREFSDVLAGSYGLQAIEAAMKEADFVCAVIPNGPVDANVLLELGVAIGTRRPSLLFVAPKADLPVSLRGQHYARASLKDAEALRFHLDAFLKNAGKSDRAHEAGRHEEPVTMRPASAASALSRLAAWEAQLSPPNEREVVSFLAEVFESSGYLTSTSPLPAGRHDFRANLAVWVDELQATIGNPLVIEVGVHSPPTIGKVHELQQLLVEFQSPLGLLVSWRPPTSGESGDDWRQPLVVQMGARELVEAINRGDFPQTLLARRHSAVHRAA